MPFYAVAKGKKPGIYTNWPECQQNTNGYPGPIFKKFDTRAEAEAFILEKGDKIEIQLTTKVEGTNPGAPSAFSMMMKKPAKVEPFEPDYYVYTDGSCSNNGKADAAAGIGIYFGENDPRNVSQRVEGKQTNNTAELTAILHTFPLIESDILKGKKVMIVSDSEYSIRCLTSYGEKCAKAAWKEEIPNKDLVRKLYELYKGQANVRFHHIMAHTGNTDVHSIGNDGADKLANLAIGLEQCPYSHAKVYLNVPFAKKDEAKNLGALWDHKEKKWYVLENSDKRDELVSLFS